jgi:hypothetical protein
MDGEEEEFVNFSCCECGIETEIDDVPYAIKEKLPSKRDFLKVGAGYGIIQTKKENSARLLFRTMSGVRRTRNRLQM